jgi:hypothetical protein
VQNFYYLCAVNKKSAYQLIGELKAQQQWASCLALFDRAWTLDYYYRLYSLILKYEPQRKYGYKQRILGNSLIISQMGGVFFN